MLAYLRLGVNNGIVREERQDSFELPQGAPGPRALPQRSSGGPPAGLKRNGVKKSLPFTYQLACLLRVWCVEMSLGSQKSLHDSIVIPKASSVRLVRLDPVGIG